MSTAKNLLLKLTTGAVFAAAAVPAFADFDVSDVLATMALVAAGVASVAVVVLGIYATIVGFRLIRKAF